MTFRDVQNAVENIKGKIHLTPVITCKSLDALASGSLRLYFKAENLQRIGAFKIRGATNALANLSKDELQRGVVTHSSGNHGQALACAGAILGTRAHIIMPSDSANVKIEAVKQYGGNVIFCEPTLSARESECARVKSETGATFVHPYDNKFVIAGQATMMVEFIDQLQQDEIIADAFIVPVGGGGMLSGCAIAAKHLSPSSRIYAAEPVFARDAQESLKQGKRVLVTETNPIPPQPHSTIADGVRTSLGEMTFPIIRDNVDAVFTVTEDQIIQAMRHVMMRAKLVIETSAAVGVAVTLYSDEFKQECIDKNVKTVGIILCGGNVDLDKPLPWL